MLYAFKSKPETDNRYTNPGLRQYDASCENNSNTHAQEMEPSHYEVVFFTAKFIFAALNTLKTVTEIEVAAETPYLCSQ